MAAARKKFKPKKGRGDREVYQEFIDQLLTGEVKATKVYDGKKNGKADLEYDDPEG